MGIIDTTTAYDHHMLSADIKRLKYEYPEIPKLKASKRILRTIFASFF